MLKLNDFIQTTNTHYSDNTPLARHGVDKFQIFKIKIDFKVQNRI